MTARPLPNTNAEKYASRNPLVGFLMGRFYSRLGALVGSIAPRSVIDVGCGEGFALSRLEAVLPPEVRACDLMHEAVAACAAAHPSYDIRQASIEALPYEDGAADLVLCLEVLEHLDDPGAALDELARVSRSDVVLSVPWAPWFQLGNLARGRNVSALGNHPEHVQGWSRRGFYAFLLASGHFDTVTLHPSFPWAIAHARTSDVRSVKPGVLL